MAPVVATRSRSRPPWPGPRRWARGPRRPGSPTVPAQVARYLGASGHQVGHLLHFTAAFAGIRHLAATAAAAGHPRRRRRGGHHRLAELAAHRRVERAAGPARPDGGGPARRDQAGDPGRRRRDQGRRLPRGGGGIRRPGRAVLAGDGGRDIGVRLGRAGRADHELPAGPRRGPAAQAGARGGPHAPIRACRPGWPRSAPRPARRCRCSVTRGPDRPMAACYEPFRQGDPGQAGLADHRHGQLGRAGQPVPAQLPGLPRGRLRAD